MMFNKCRMLILFHFWTQGDHIFWKDIKLNIIEPIKLEKIIIKMTEFKKKKKIPSKPKNSIGLESSLIKK